MARRSARFPLDEELGPDFWLELCGDPSPTSRDKFLFLTIDEFGRVGPGGFGHASIARRLGVTVAMINHYFGSRNGLISEAAYLVYCKYMEAMARAVDEAPRDPESRLRAWISTQISFAVSVAGWAVVLNYPTLSLEDPVEFTVLFRKRISAKFNANMARLSQLISDVQSGTVTPMSINEDNLDVATYMTDMKLVTLSSTIAMSTLGAAVWAAGSHVPSAESDEAKQLGDMLLAQHANYLVDLVKTEA
jgi:AcrR family transcriptional regulator